MSQNSRRPTWTDVQLRHRWCATINDKSWASSCLICNVFVCVVVVCQTAHAQMEINYGDFFGANYSYLDVTETYLTDSPILGPPDLVDDQLDFDLASFTASTPGKQTTSAMLELSVQADDSTFISTISSQSGGNIQLAGLGLATAEATVDVALELTVTAVDAIPLTLPSATSVMTFLPTGGGPNGGHYVLASDAGSFTWFGSLVADIDALLVDQGISGRTTAVDIAWTQTLMVSATQGGSAFISVSPFDTLPIHIVSEPTNTMTLWGLTLLVLTRYCGHIATKATTY